MRIGYACIPLTVNYRTNRGFILKNFTYERLCSTVKENLNDLKLILQSNIKNNIYLFRISSDIIPFGSHEVNDINWWDIFQEELSDIGNFIIENSIRVSMHPGQYTVLNSPSKEVLYKSIKELEYHNRFLNSLGVDNTNKIVTHVGGVYGDKKSAADRFLENFKYLSDSCKERIIVENDEKMYDIEDVLNICNKINVPAVLDNLHHKCNPSLSNDFNLIIKEVISTWKEKDGVPKVHYSDEDKTKRLGAHSSFVYSENFLEYYNKIKNYEIDIMLEVKDKDISAIKCTNLLSAYNDDNKIKKSIIYKEWARYKYLVMEKDYSLYKKCSALVNSKGDIVEFYKFVDECLDMPFNERNFINTAQHVWGYFKKVASEKEKMQFSILMENSKEYIKIKEKLKRLAIKYNEEYLLDSYYFNY